MTFAARLVAPPRAPAFAGAVAAYAAVAVATAAIVHAGPAAALAGDALALSAELVAGALLVVAAFVVPARAGARFPALLVATGVALPLGEWNSPGAGPAFNVGLVAWAAWPPLLAAAALRGPGERPLTRAGATGLALAVATGVGVLGVACASVLDPVAHGCVDCPVNRLLIAGDADVWQTLSRAGLVTTIAWTAFVACVLAVSLVRSSPGGRWIAAPVLVPCAAALALYGAQAAHGLDRGFLSNDPTDRTLWAAQLTLIAAAALGVTAAPLYRRRTRSALARLVLELGATPSTGGLRERLAQAFGDPGLQLLHAREDGRGWVDAQGAPAEPAAGHDVTRVVAHGHPVSALVHRPRLIDNPALAAEIARAARLALEHERLHALHRAQLTQLRASRARLVAMADGERRQLERDLHDGAQQRLVTLAIETRLARRRNPGFDATLATVEDDLRVALGELRDVARGLYPAVLAAEGLAAALETLAEDDLSLTLGTLTEDRFPEAAESAAYFLVAETLRHGPVHVDTRVEGGCLVVDARGPAPRSPRIEDRVLAAGGTFSAAAGRIRAELPCVS